MLGIEAKLYRNTGSYGSPSWSEVTCVGDLTVNGTWDQGDANSRASRIKIAVKTMLDVTISGNLKNKPGDANYEAIMDALVGDQAVDFLVLNGPRDEDGVRGWRFDGQVFDGSEDQGMGVGAINTAFTIKPTDSDNVPQAVKVSGSSLTYATPGDSTFT